MFKSAAFIAKDQSGTIIDLYVQTQLYLRTVISTTDGMFSRLTSSRPTRTSLRLCIWTARHGSKQPAFPCITYNFDEAKYVHTHQQTSKNLSKCWFGSIWFASVLSSFQFVWYSPGAERELSNSTFTCSDWKEHCDSSSKGRIQQLAALWSLDKLKVFIKQEEEDLNFHLFRSHVSFYEHCAKQLIGIKF